MAKKKKDSMAHLQFGTQIYKAGEIKNPGRRRRGKGNSERQKKGLLFGDSLSFVVHSLPPSLSKLLIPPNLSPSLFPQTPDQNHKLQTNFSPYEEVRPSLAKTHRFATLIPQPPNPKFNKTHQSVVVVFVLVTGHVEHREVGRGDVLAVGRQEGV